MASEKGGRTGQKSGVGPSHRDHPSEEEEEAPPAQTGADVCGQAVGGVDICQFFLQGRCHFGSQCRFLHSVSPSQTVREKKLSSEQDKEEKIKKRRNQKKGHKDAAQSKEPDSEELSKKPRMRPAEDVVSRILWDPSLDPSDFSVGYLDRFLGVLERPFSEFSWDRDVCSCDFTKELALPKHRIKYFTYKGKRVWDRESRMDAVFGSTGGEVEPPFCAQENEGEAHLTEESALNDVENAQEPQEDLQKCVENKDDEKTSAGESSNKDTGTGQQVQEPSLRKMARRDAEGNRNTRTTVMNKENTENKPEKRESEQGTELPVLTAQLHLSQSDNSNTEKAEGLEEEWKDSWDGEEKLAHLSMHGMFSSQQGSASGDEVLTKFKSLEQRSQPSRYRPTHFITFRTDSPDFIASFHRLRKEITALLPLSAPYWVIPETLHVTLCLLILPGPREVTMACEALRDFARRQRPVSLSLSCSPKLGHFGGRVLYVAPEPVCHIQSLNRHLQGLYKSKGWLHRDSLSPRYHLTVAKVPINDSARPFRDVDNNVVAAEKMSAINFGKLAVNKLYLCVNRSSRGEDGFYETLCTIDLQ